MLLPDISGLYPPPSRGSTPPFSSSVPAAAAWSLLLLLASHLRLALGCLLVAAACCLHVWCCWMLLSFCLLVAAACCLHACCCWMLAACCLLSAPFCWCCCLGLLAAVGAEESLFVRIESSCIPSEYILKKLVQACTHPTTPKSTNQNALSAVHADQKMILTTHMNDRTQ